MRQGALTLNLLIGGSLVLGISDLLICLKKERGLERNGKIDGMGGTVEHLIWPLWCSKDACLSLGLAGPSAKENVEPLVQK